MKQFLLTFLLLNFSLLGSAGNNIITSSFDNGVRETTRTFRNGLVTTNSFNLDNTIQSKILATRADLSYIYTYDANKNVMSETSTGTVMDNFNFSTGFDDIDRVTSWTRLNTDTQSWNLDKIGNWQSTTGLLDSNSFNETRTHNDAHELTSLMNGSSGTLALAYDAKGNLTENSHGHDYTWDIDNHLKQAYKGNGKGGGIGKGSGNGLPNGLCQYEYDAIGRRVKKHVGNVETLFISSGHQVIAEYTSQAGQPYSLDKEYVYDSYIDDVVAKVESGNTLYYHSDRQFNVRGLTNSAGAIVELYAYSVYGKQTILDVTGTEIMESANGNCYGFTGRYLDEETGLWYFRARYFDNEMGRFISRDPLGFVDGFSLYNGYFASGFGLDPWGLLTESFDFTSDETYYPYENNDCYFCSKYGIKKQKFKQPFLGLRPGEAIHLLAALTSLPGKHMIVGESYIAAVDNGLKARIVTHTQFFKLLGGLVTTEDSKDIKIELYRCNPQNGKLLLQGAVVVNPIVAPSYAQSITTSFKVIGTNPHGGEIGSIQVTNSVSYLTVSDLLSAKWTIECDCEEFKRVQ